MNNKPQTIDDLANLSDEEFKQLSEPEDVVVPDEHESDAEFETESDPEATESEDETIETEDTESNDSEEGTDETEAEESSDDDSDDQSDIDASDNTDADDLDESSDNVNDNNAGDNNESDSDKKEQTEIDASILFKPFQAGGKQMQVKNVEEALSLMKWGAQFRRNMQETVPYRRTAKVLADNKIDDNQLNYLIDLNNKNPEAIRKFAQENAEVLQDTGFGEEPVNYTPSNYNNDQVGQAIQIQDTFNSIYSNYGQKTYDRVLDVASKLDNASKDVISQDSKALEILGSHMNNGVFDKIDAEVHRQQALGYLSSDGNYINDYVRVASALIEQGELNLQSNKPSNNGLAEFIDKPSTVKQALSQNTNNESPEIKAKRKAASPTKKKAGKQLDTSNINPLDMDDETFMKQFGNRL